MLDKADIGVVGLAVMGENLALNMAGKGYTVTVYNRTPEKVDRFLAGRARNKSIRGAKSLAELVGSLSKPSKVMLMVKAGPVIDELIEQLIPLLEPDAIIIDGGNTQYEDTNRRMKYIESRGLRYIGTGISGGEEGALTGPSIMPGGSREAWEPIRPIFQAIAAKVDDGRPCCEWVGEGGAGHFVKMVHNGIEYGDMQLICEAYQLLKDVLSMSHREMHAVFAEWNDTELNSYLIEITRDILGYEEEGTSLVEQILDVAGQKGTGKWTAVAALDLGVPLTLIGEAVFARCLSAQKGERIAASELLPGPDVRFTGDREVFVDDLRKAVTASKIVSYAQGYALMRAAAEEFGWNLDFGAIAMTWRGGCIIRSSFLNNIRQAYDADPSLTNLMLDDYFRQRLLQAQGAWRRIVAEAAKHGISVPAISAGLNYFDGYRSARLPANLLQAQRDYFGAHTYERVDRPRGDFFHTNWTGRGGTTSSTPYNA